MRMILIILGIVLVGAGGGGIAKGGNGILPVQAKIEIKINNSVRSSANGEECVKSEVIEESGEGNISIKSELECVSDSNDINVGADSNIRPEDGEGGGGIPEGGNGIPPVRKQVRVQEKLIIFDRESYRKYVLGMGDDFKNYSLTYFSALVRSLSEGWKNTSSE